MLLAALLAVPPAAAARSTLGLDYMYADIRDLPRIPAYTHEEAPETAGNWQQVISAAAPRGHGDALDGVDDSPKRAQKSPSSRPSASRIPHWTMPAAAQPNVSLPAAGLRMLAGGTAHANVYSPNHKLCCTTAVPPCDRSPACLGTYNHAPLISEIRSGSGNSSVLVVAWHNGPFDEDSPLGRALYSQHSRDGGADEWAPAAVMFDALPGTSSPGR
jgi:hypothetical protein